MLISSANHLMNAPTETPAARPGKTGPVAPEETAARLRLAITRTARRLRQEAGSLLGPSASAALATIERLGPLTPSELAEAEAIRRPTATRILSRLAEEGMIDRAADPDDGRCSIVSVTAEGRKHLRALRHRKNAYLAQRMRELSGDEVATLERAAEILERVLEERGS
jgi:DNA-binding MarR family transcriptional regulator